MSTVEERVNQLEADVADLLDRVMDRVTLSAALDNQNANDSTHSSLTSRVALLENQVKSVNRTLATTQDSIVRAILKDRTTGKVTEDVDFSVNASVPYGPVVTSPDSSKKKRIGIDDAGALTLTDVA